MGPPWLYSVVASALLLASHAEALQRRAAEVKPAPILVPYSQAWDGSDGSWSSFTLSLGGPNRVQTIRVFPSTSLYQVWAIAPQGCPTGWQGGQNKCEDQRGGIFNSNMSNTWLEKSMYAVDNMQFVNAYGYDNLAVDFGWDTVMLGYPGAGIPPVKHQLIGQLWDYGYTSVGLLGLDPKPTNFTDMMSMSGGQPSLLQTLKDNKTIPSLSYGYHAGAKYKDPPLFGSLTLGGYDKNRIQGNAATFAFGNDVESQLIVPLTAVRTKAASDSNPFRSPQTVLIDSTRPYVYLPHALCMSIAYDYGLTFDKNFQWLLVNDTAYQRLKASDAQLIIELGTPGAANHIEVTLPFGAIVQPLDYPYKGNKTNYIPIRPSNGTQQYVLGRTFLQEAYLKVDYERRKFSIYQARASSDSLLKPIFYDPKNPDNEDGASSTLLSKAAIAGIAAGAAGLFTIIAALVFCFCRRKKQRTVEEKQASLKALDISSPITSGTGTLYSPSSTLSPDTPRTIKNIELDSGTVHESGGSPLYPHDTYNSELRNEPASPVVGELDSASTAFGGFYKEVKSMNGDKPIIKVYYEMDASPTGSAENTPSSTMSNSTTLVGSNGANMPSIQHMLSPVPQTPAEYYERGGAGRGAPVRKGDRSSIPQTPLEFYGGMGKDGRPVPTGLLDKTMPSKNTSGGLAPPMPTFDFTPATPRSPDEREVERSRWLRGHSGRRKDKEKDEKGEK